MRRKFDFTQLALYALWVVAIGILVASIVFCCGDVLAPDIVGSDCIEETTSCSLSETSTTTATAKTAETTLQDTVEETSSDSTTTTTSIAMQITTQISSTTTTTTTSTATSTTTTSATSAATQSTSSSPEDCAAPDIVEETASFYDTPSVELTYLGSFRGTYYRGSTNPCKGGSGRTLIDCAYGNGEVKGSVACRYIYANYGYNIGDRTMVYIESAEYPSLTGWYYVDDCCESYTVVDFYYANYSTCPFRIAGVISVKLYI